MKLLAEQAAQDVTTTFELSAPPIDVVALAQRLGVRSLQTVELVEDGRLERTNGTARIFVREGLSPERRRFTIAHELAHLLLSDPNSDFVARRHKIGADQEERFCEDFAAALLLPSVWVRHIAKDRPRDLHTLRRVAGRSNTSLAASCVRLNEVAGWQRTLMHWRLLKGRWGFRWAAGLPPGFVGHIRTSDLTRQALEAARDQGGDATMPLPLRIGRTDHIIDAIVSVRHSSGLALGQLHQISEQG